MSLNEAIVIRLQQLIDESKPLSSGGESADSLEQCHECEAWLVSAQNAVHVVCESEDNPCCVKVDDLAEEDHEWMVNRAVGIGAAVLRNLLADANAGLLASVADQARAEILDDFLDSADYSLDSSRKNEAGVIAGVVFEDSIRRICRKLDIPEKGLKLDGLISELATAGQFSSVQAKRARAAADVRTKASHAQWDEFAEGDVRAAIHFAREIISQKLDG